MSLISRPDAFVFIHQGLPSYLLCSLYQAHFASPKLRKILVSDIDPKLPFVDWINLNYFSDSWNEMAAVYVHLSTNQASFERFCFYRWFVLRAVMKNRGLTRIIHLDSDVMVYFDPLEEVADLGAHRFAIGSTSSYSGHFAVINSLTVIDEICDVMVNLFADPANLGELEEHFKRQGPLGGGVCDMYALGWIIWNKRMPCFELNVIRDYGVFDQALRDPRVAGKRKVWRMKGGKKVVKWKNSRPFFLTIDGDEVRALTIHFQGDCKSLMRSCLTQVTTDFLEKYYAMRIGEWSHFMLNHVTRRARHYKQGVYKRSKKLMSRLGL
ncbi:hypothetical protein ACFL1V_02470 [Pseudomonadota bacterium]